MTEHEKLLAGQEYDYKDPVLQQMMGNTRVLLNEYNAAAFTDGNRRSEILKEMLDKCGENVVIQQPFKCLYGKHIRLGNDIMINYNCDILDSNIVTIGHRVLLGPDVKIFCGNHSLDPRERFKRLDDGILHVITTTKPVTIGSDVWIGGGAIILPGVTIGNNVVIGSGAVVTKDIPDNCVAVGNPAKVIRKLPEPKELH